VTRRAETLDLAILGLLHDSPLHGYELRKRLNIVLGWGRVLSYGSLYPALKRMLRAGWISEYVAAPDATGRGSKGTSRRPRIVYELTAQGGDHFSGLMSDAGPASWEDETFDVRFAFFGRIDREIRLRILEGRRARMEERLARLRQAPAGESANSYTAELHRHGLELVEREVRWLNDLIAAERNPAPRQPASNEPTTIE